MSSNSESFSLAGFKAVQGKPRSLPDGFLHAWNFAATKASGMAGAVFNHIVEDKQRDIIEQVLIQRAVAAEKQSADSAEELAVILADPYHPKRLVRFQTEHNCWRFRKTFLQEHFQISVYSSMYACGRNTAALAAFEINREYTSVVRSNKLVASDNVFSLERSTLDRLNTELN